MKIKKKQIMRYAENLEERIHKLEQKELLSKMMQDDEKDGIYEEPFMRAKGMHNIGRVNQTGEELNNFLKEHPNKSLSPIKIAIRVENEQEFNNLMNIYSKKGWHGLRFDIDKKPTPYKWSFIDETSNFIEYKDNYGTYQELPFGYQIIDFKILKAILQ